MTYTSPSLFPPRPRQSSVMQFIYPKLTGESPFLAALSLKHKSKLRTFISWPCTLPAYFPVFQQHALKSQLLSHISFYCCPRFTRRLLSVLFVFILADFSAIAPPRGVVCNPFYHASILISSRTACNDYNLTLCTPFMVPIRVSSNLSTRP